MEYTPVNKVIIILNRGHGCEYFQDATEYTNLCTTTYQRTDHDIWDWGASFTV